MYISSALALVALTACAGADFVSPGSPSPGSASDQPVSPAAAAAAGYAGFHRYPGSVYYPTQVTFEKKFVGLPVDHFSNTPRSEQFMMPYIEHSESFQSGGPIYILICEKFESEQQLLQNGLLPELARETHGIMFAIGQRYSDILPIPTNVEYLSTKQILYDIAKFITIIKDKKERIQSKVVIVGTGAAGKLAYWMKANFNSLVDIAITDASPQVHLEDSKIEHLIHFFRKIGGNACVKQIQDKLEHQQTLLRQPNGAEEVRKRELLCPGTNLTDKAQWYTYNAVVYSQLIKALSLEQYQASQLCNKYVQSTEAVNEDFCFVLPNSTHWRSRSNYLQCSEYGTFATSNGTGALPLDIPLQWYIDTCRQNYGEKFNEEYIRAAVKRTSEEYEKANVTKVVFLSEYPDVTLKSSNGMNAGAWMQNWEEHDGVERVKASIKKWISYMDRRSIDKYYFFFPSQPNMAPFV